MTNMHDSAPHLRCLTSADADACDQIILSLPHHFGDPGGRAECARAVRSSSGLVAVVGGRVGGFLTVQHHFALSAEITWMAIAPAQRRHGLGRLLIQHLCEDLRRGGVRLLLVHTLAASVEGDEVADGYGGTRAFYRAQGFIDAQEIPGYWPNSVALLMVMLL